ncbi:hypothetical protein [Sphingobium xenophagum]|uniref:hypothetical protein n=1 Tax=Sphingobium xenophagum TaxID=121428 RepID=UPI001C0C4210|nr:hypothetical protein [Sphingobium xenophagum]QWT15330.1 hypothetical protein GTV57_06205 [Sphingobium xenophagum]
MNNYDNPNLTQREVVEESLAQTVALITAVTELEQTTKANREAAALDNSTNTLLAMQVSVFQGVKINLEAEKDRLEAIIAKWDDQEAE